MQQTHAHFGSATKGVAKPESSWLFQQILLVDWCVLFWNKVNAQHTHQIRRVKLIPLAGFAGWLIDLT